MRSTFSRLGSGRLTGLAVIQVLGRLADFNWNVKWRFALHWKRSRVVGSRQVILWRCHSIHSLLFYVIRARYGGMGYSLKIIGFAVAAAGLYCLSVSAVFADKGELLDPLFETLKTVEQEYAAQVADEINRILDDSGSASSNLLLMRGREAIEAGSFHAAVEHFSAVTEHAPDFAEGWHMLAVANHKIGKTGLALSDIQRALALEPRHFKAIVSLGMLFTAQGQYEKAIGVFEEAQSIHPNIRGVKDYIAKLRVIAGITDI